ncbi:unnamed protein product [Microthlaspi erraticum]|uniref:DUF1517 domain-containing protein n=1 Tax=Microthlaspi erraticum TaxID=1685480 RepID=A0A6D2J568_9BRAS|nr:unnamed protein product [Microthlaspi erraticum]
MASTYTLLQLSTVVLGLLLFCDPNCAFAKKTGGRIGGSAFSSPSRTSSCTSRSSSSSYSRTYHVPSYSRSESYSYSYSKPDAIDILFLCVLCSVALGLCVYLSQGEKTSVLKLQLGLLGVGRKLQKDFDRLAEDADTSTLKGLSYVLNEATLALLRHPDYCIACHSSVDVKSKQEEGEKLFNQLSIEERRKVDEETVVNVDSIKRQNSRIRTASGSTSEYIVVTILVATKGVQKLQPMNGIADLKEALKKLGSLPSDRIKAVELLWTPEDENEVLSERELRDDFPLLTPF